MNVLFIIQKVEIKFVPLGIGYISSYLEKYGNNTYIVCAKKFGDENILKFIAEKEIEIVGFMALTFMVPEMYRIAELIKKTHPECIIICGGIHPSALPILTLEECKYIDVVVIGQGEEITLKLVQSIENNKKFDDIEGIAFRDGDKIIRNRGRGVLKNIDVLPYPKRELITTEEQKFKDITIALSRGCHYCNNIGCSIFPKIVQMRTILNVIDEIKYTVSKYKPQAIELNHNFSLYDKDWLKKFFLQIKRYNFYNKIQKWSISTFVDVIDEELLELLSDIKFWDFDLDIGEVTFDDKIIHNMGMNFTVKDIIDIVNKCKKYKIPISPIILFGNIGETKETILKTIQILKEIHPDVLLRVRRPFPGTPLYRKGIKEGYDIKSRWREYTMDELTQLPFVGTSLSPNEIWQFRNLAEAELLDCGIKVYQPLGSSTPN